MEEKKEKVKAEKALYRGKKGLDYEVPFSDIKTTNQKISEHFKMKKSCTNK